MIEAGEDSAGPQFRIEWLLLPPRLSPIFCLWLYVFCDIINVYMFFGDCQTADSISALDLESILISGFFNWFSGSRAQPQCLKNS